MSEPIYRGEAILLNWNDNKSGRKIVLQIEKDAPGAHPFDGLDGERFAVVIVGPLASDEHSVAREGGVERSHGNEAAPVGATKADNAPPTKPKRRWKDMPASQRAALWIKDPEVWAFLNRSVPPGIEPVRNERDADAELKRLLSIASKADLDDPAPNFDSARTKLQVLQSQLLAERQARGHGVI